HLLEESQEHCDRVLIMDQGKIVLDGHPDELRRVFRGAQALKFLLREELNGAAVDRLAALPGVVRCASQACAITVLLDSGEVPLQRIAEIVQPFGVEEVVTRKASLREIFFEVVDTTAWER